MPGLDPETNQTEQLVELEATFSVDMQLGGDQLAGLDGFTGEQVTKNYDDVLAELRAVEKVLNRSNATAFTKSLPAFLVMTFLLNKIHFHINHLRWA